MASLRPIGVQIMQVFYLSVETVFSLHTVMDKGKHATSRRPHMKDFDWPQPPTSLFLVVLPL
jgi:hypothetical protein